MGLTPYAHEGGEGDGGGGPEGVVLWTEVTHDPAKVGVRVDEGVFGTEAEGGVAGGHGGEGEGGCWSDEEVGRERRGLRVCS